MPIDNPEYKAQADKLLESVRAVKKAAETYGVKSTGFTLALLAEMMKVSTVVGSFASLPKDQRDEFFAEVWDAAIGVEPNALVNQLGFLSPESTESISDAIKEAVISYFNRTIPVA
jgi:hypothetical protein